MRAQLRSVNQVRRVIACLFFWGLSLASCDDGEAPSADAGALAGSAAGEVAGGEGGGLTLDPQSCVRYSYDLSYAAPQTFPDDALTVASQETRTGLKLSVTELPWVEGQSAFVKQLMGDLDQLDGWGINAGVILRFTAPLPTLPSGPETGEPDSPVLLFRVDGVDEGPLYPQRVPVEVRSIEEGQAQIFEPMLPLKPATRYALLIRQMDEEWLGADHCLAQGEELTQLLEGAADRASQPYPLSEGLAEAIETAGVARAQVAALTIFTTQSEPMLSLEIAEHIKAQRYEWLDEPSCEAEDELYTLCTRSFMAMDFRDEGVIREATPHAEHPVKVYFWKPTNRVDERPVILYGHGIGGDVYNSYGVLEMLNGKPISMLAIDAVAHGEHPDAPSGPGDNSAQTVFKFFALDLPSQTIQALKARDNFRQSTYEKLQLIELLHQDADINADGRADLDPSMIAYYGLSLGGIMGVELLALEPRISAGLLTVPGARLVSVITDGSLIGSFIPIIHNLVGGEEAFNSFTPLAQVLIDGADPGSFAPWVLHHRQDEAAPPHLLMQMAIDDGTVPNAANRALARGLGLPHVGPVAQDVGLLELEGAPSSLSLELDGLQRTVGLFQYDRVSQGLNQVRAATHTNMPYGREGSLQATRFLFPWAEGEAPIIVDPYEVFGVPELP